MVRNGLLWKNRGFPEGTLINNGLRLFILFRIQVFLSRQCRKYGKRPRHGRDDCLRDGMAPVSIPYPVK